jgi:hypothetical protein
MADVENCLINTNFSSNLFPLMAIVFLIGCGNPRSVNEPATPAPSPPSYLGMWSDQNSDPRILPSEIMTITINVQHGDYIGGTAYLFWSDTSSNWPYAMQNGIIHSGEIIDSMFFQPKPSSMVKPLCLVFKATVTSLSMNGTVYDSGKVFLQQITLTRRSYK